MSLAWQNFGRKFQEISYNSIKESAGWTKGGTRCPGGDEFDASGKSKLRQTKVRQANT